MSKSFVFTLAALFLGLICSEVAGVDNRIVGGVAYSIKRVKYLVSLRINGEFSCGGTLISSMYVVTAAHCVKGVKAKSLTVVGGATFLKETGVRRGVKTIILPTSYNANTVNMDVAVLKLATAMTGRNISPIKLCNSSWKAGDNVQVSGWGLTSYSASKVPNRVRTVKVPLIKKSTCVSRYSGQATLTKTMFCASKLGSKDACSGDSGGPAVYKGRLCGIVSWGIGCASNKYPGVYTNVKVVKKFIKKAINL